MDLVKSQLEDVRQYLYGIKAQMDAVVDHAPPGVLTCQRKGKYEQMMHMFVEEGRRVRRGIARNPEMQKKLMSAFDPEDLLRSMPAAYKKLPADFFFDRDHLVTDLHLSGEEQVRILRHREWGRAHYQASTYKPEWKKHRTSRGLKMRSKSEVLIMEKLYHYEIDVRYEQEWEFGNETFAPDFTFEAENGELFCWEHLGMMDDPAYAARNYQKLMKYYKYGFVLGKI